jgi:hypothetical protein
MKPWRICLVVVVLGLLSMLVSCTGGEVSRDDTEDFINGLQMMFYNAGMSESSMVLEDFSESNPPGPDFSSAGSLETSTENLRALRDPFGLDSIYGTWDYRDIQGWVHVDPNDPANAVLFTWEYYDTNDVEHDAELLIDSLEFYGGAADTLPTKIWIGLNLDGSDIAWLKFGAHYISEEEADSVSLIYRIINLFEMGISITTLVDVDTTLDMDSAAADFVGTVRLWAENLVTDYHRVDFSVTRYSNDSGRLLLEDSRGWDMVINVSEDLSTDPEYERRDVDGEITKNGNHAASIEGIIWDPEDATHVSQVIIIFSDDTEGDYTYLGDFFSSFME